MKKQAVRLAFQSLSGLTLGLNLQSTRRARCLAGEFQSLSGLTLGLNALKKGWKDISSQMFQSLSGLTLGLNSVSCAGVRANEIIVSIPFRADTGFEHDTVALCIIVILRFYPFQG